MWGVCAGWRPVRARRKWLQGRGVTVGSRSGEAAGTGPPRDMSLLGSGSGAGSRRAAQGNTYGAHALALLPAGSLRRRVALVAGRARCLRVLCCPWRVLVPPAQRNPSTPSGALALARSPPARAALWVLAHQRGEDAAAARPLVRVRPTHCRAAPRCGPAAPLAHALGRLWPCGVHAAEAAHCARLAAALAAVPGEHAAALDAARLPAVRQVHLPRRAVGCAVPCRPCPRPAPPHA
jgi:hypothetical protein